MASETGKLVVASVSVSHWLLASPPLLHSIVNSAEAKLVVVE